MPRADLSILVLTLPDRAAFLTRLLGRLQPQVVPQVELLIATDEGEVTIGEKRNRILDASQGRYVCYVDDDDLVAPNYVAEILGAIQQAPDCVGFKTKRHVDGKAYGEAVHSIRYTKYVERYSRGFRSCLYERTPNHFNPVRRELAEQVRFQPWNCGEDRDYSTRLRPLLQTEVFVDQYLYEYYYRSRNTREHERVNRDQPH